MANRKPYQRKFNVLSAWSLKAIALVIAGAATVIVARTVTKSVSTKPDLPQDGKFVGVRHEATSVPAMSETRVGVTTTDCDQEQEVASNTVVRNGVTVVSPPLLVPVIDITSLQAPNGSEDGASSSKSSTTRKRTRYADRTHSHRQTRTAATRWKAYGLAIR